MRKEFNSHRTLTWTPFYCFGTPTWREWRHVKTPCKWIKGVGGGKGKGSFEIIGPFIRGKIRRELYHLYEHVLSNKTRLISDEMCRLYGKFVSYLRRVLCKTHLIFPRINGPNVWFYLTLLFSFDLFTAARCCCWCFFLYVWFSFAKHSIQLLVNLNQCTNKIRKRAQSHLY